MQRPGSAHSHQIGVVHTSAPVDMKLPQLQLTGPASPSMTFTSTPSLKCKTSMLHDTSL